MNNTVDLTNLRNSIDISNFIYKKYDEVKNRFNGTNTPGPTSNNVSTSIPITKNPLAPVIISSPNDPAYEGILKSNTANVPRELIELNLDSTMGFVTNINYDSNKYDVLYHEEKEYKPWDKETTYVTYNPYGTFKYGAASYVPSYEDSVILSKTHGIRNVEKPKFKTRSRFRGDFCTNTGLSKEAVDEICNKLPLDVCMDTSCCVSIGKYKCAAGDDTGPWLITNYNDPVVLNKDYYYYMNKCYGNCP